jgi:hypothetical protein
VSPLHVLDGGQGAESDPACLDRMRQRWLTISFAVLPGGRDAASISPLAQWPGPAGFDGIDPQRPTGGEAA